MKTEEINMNSNPSKHEIEYVREALMRFNDEYVGADGHTPLNLIEYDADGNVIGGILGGTYWGWMYIDILWVREDHRKTGIGSKLLAEAEKEAREIFPTAEAGFDGKHILMQFED